MPDYDVAVVGLGIIGSCALWQLAARGVSALGIDRHDPPHALGSSHGHSRVVRRIQFEGDEYVALGDRAYELWAALERETGRRLLTRTGLLIIGPAGSQLIRGGRQSAERADLAHEVLDTRALSERYPQHCVEEGEIALFDPEAGYISPEQAVTAALERAVALGATVQRNSGVERLDEVRARHLVVAAGAWTGSLVPELAPLIALERHFFAWVPVRDPARFAPERFPIWIRENRTATERSIEDSHAHSERIVAFGFPSTDGRRVKVGFPVTGTSVASPEIDPRPRPEELARLEPASLAALLDGASTPATDFTVCLYDNSPDGRFIIDALPGRPDVTVLAGFSGHGFKHAPAVGELAAALATGARPPLDVSPFSASRLLA